MLNASAALIHTCIKRLQSDHRQTYGGRSPGDAELVAAAAALTLTAIARSTAHYHNLEHTVLVVYAGQAILRGKQIQSGGISSRDWAHYVISLLCHDIGYIRGVCQQDCPEQHTYTTGIGRETVTIAATATDASLSPYHVDRSKRFIEEAFAQQPLLDVDLLKQNVEQTRFPAPACDRSPNRSAQLARAADLIGQLGDPRYLSKMPALFAEFEEVGSHRSLGYHQPSDLRAGYPKFFHGFVYPQIQEALGYLAATRRGRQILTQLYANLSTVEQELLQPGRSAAIAPVTALLHQTIHKAFRRCDAKTA